MKDRHMTYPSKVGQAFQDSTKVGIGFGMLPDTFKREDKVFWDSDQGVRMASLERVFCHDGRASVLQAWNKTDLYSAEDNIVKGSPCWQCVDR